MYTMRLNKSDKTISLRRVTKKLTLNRIGRRGIQGPKGDKGDSGEASNLVTSVNGKQGVVVLDKTDIGLSNVDNTSDLSKPISTATQTALDLKANLASLALVATSGSYNDLSDKPTIPDTSNLVPNTRTVNGHPLSSDVTVTKSDVGLSNVDNTSDANKPVSSATQTALNAKANESEVIKVGGQSSSGTLSFGTTNASGVHLLVNNNPLIRVTPIGNVGINVGSEPEVPFLVGGGLFTQAGPVFAEINPDSGVDLSIGTTTNHPVNLVTNNATRLTIGTDGSITSQGDLHMSEKKVIDIADGTNARDAVNKQQLDLKANTSSLSTVALSGAYNDLSGKPTLGSAASQNSTAFATAAQGSKADSAVQSVVAGANVTVDNTDPQNPVISTDGGGGAPSGAAGGDLGGTYPDPTVPGLASKVETINGDGFIDVDVSDFPTVGLNFVGSDTPTFNASKLRDTDISGTLSTGLDDGDLLRYNASNGWEADTLDKTDIGLGNVDNTSDINKPISTATQTALDTKYTIPAGFTAGTVLGKNFGGTDSPVSYSQDTTGFNLVMRDIDGQIPGVTPTDATDLANKAYVDSAAAAGTPDATTSVKGKLQLAGDLGGTSALPTIKRTVRLTVSRDATRLADYYCDGTDDDVQINAAIAAANTAGGGTVKLLSGSNSYRISSAIVLKENVSVIGERWARQASGGTTLKTQASSSLTSLLTFTGTSNPSTNADLIHDTRVENITVDGNNTTTNAVLLTNQDTIKFYNCRFIQCTNSINTVWDSSIDPVAATIPGSIFIDSCNISSVSGIGINLQYQTQCWITNCWFTGTTVSDWIVIKSSNKMHILNCEFNTATNALRFQDTATMPTNDNTILGNVFAVGTGNRAWKEERTNANSVNTMISGTVPSGVIYDSLINYATNYVSTTAGKFPFAVLSTAAADKLLTLKGFASQSGRYVEAQNSGGTAIAYMNSGGNWYVNNGSTSAVSYGFTSEINSGMYRIGASNLGFSLGGAKYLDLSTTAATFTADVVVPDEAYDATAWNGSLEVPTKNAIRDKIESLSAGGITRTVVVTSGNVTAGASASTDYVYLIAGAHTVTLPTAVGNINRYTLKNNHSANVSLAFTSSQTADGGGITLAPSESVDLISNNTNWSII